MLSCGPGLLLGVVTGSYKHSSKAEGRGCFTSWASEDSSAGVPGPVPIVSGYFSNLLSFIDQCPAVNGAIYSVLCAKN